MYQGEPGEEFGGRLVPMSAIDPSLRHRFAPDEEEEEDIVGKVARGNELRLWC
jgi:hypothetical protein